MASKSLVCLSAQQDLNLAELVRVYEITKKEGIKQFNIPLLLRRLSEIETILKEAKQIHVNLEMEATAQDRASLPYFLNNTWSAILKARDTADIFFCKHLARLQEQQNQTLASSVGSLSSPLGASSAPSVHVRLPQLDLPRFSGEYSEWTNFRDLFQTVIIENQTLSDVERFQYLKLSVFGEAAQAIKALAVNHASFQIAWNLLVDRYQNNRLMISSLLSKLFSLPPIEADRLSRLKFVRDTTFNVLDSLQQVGCSTDNWDPLVIFLLVQKFDSMLKQEWEKELGDTADYPNLSVFNSFLNRRIRTLEVLEMSPSSFDKSHPKSGCRTRSHNSVVVARKCVVCGGSHRIYTCQKFLSKAVEDRLKFRTQHRLCVNCLASGHSVENCKSRTDCVVCSKRHHTLLHMTKKGSDNGDENKKRLSTALSEVTTHFNAALNSEVLLTTAMVRIRSFSGRVVMVRALLDLGSETSFISESVVQALKLPRRRIDVAVVGLGETPAKTLKHSTRFTVESVHDCNTFLAVQAYVLNSITAYKPKAFNSRCYPEFRNLSLADTDPSNGLRVELLLGADVFGQILKGRIRRAVGTSVIAQATIFGWVFSGPTNNITFPPRLTVQHSTLDISDALRQFWEMEEVPASVSLSPDDENCERKFVSIYSRLSTGRFVVRLPFITEEARNTLGDTKQLALSSWKRLDRRFTHNPELASTYNQFLEEYEALGHMTALSPLDLTTSKIVYLPHHAVVREQSTTTKIRVVFNASAKSSNGVALNDLLLAGPKLQTDICALILNWRFYRYVLTADIEKMFRQVLIHSDDQNYQCIFWRRPGDSEITTFRLNTVTYGTKPAPFLAMRVIRQLVKEHGDEFPLAVTPLTSQIYVDDVIFGAQDRELAIQIRDQVTSLLKRGEFVLRKWASNSLDLLPAQRPNRKEVEFLSIEPSDRKVLGIVWSPTDDVFKVKVSLEIAHHITKRTMLAHTSSIFDPSGWLSPIIIRAKIMLQSLWLQKLEWDDPVPAELAKRWLDWYKELTLLQNLAIPRHVMPECNFKTRFLTGYADASSKAYSAAVYFTIEVTENTYSSHLLIAKSKVAPLKTISVPRLELCGATLLTKLLKYVLSHSCIAFQQISCFTDSRIVLAWLAKQPFEWQTFVANRVSFIQTQLPEAKWFHVPSGLNPADLNSRGLPVKDFLASTLWWKGPPNLSFPTHAITLQDNNEIQGEAKRPVSNFTVVAGHLSLSETSWLTRFSTWSKLLRVTTLVYKFGAKLRSRVLLRDTSLSSMFSAEKKDSPSISQIILRQVQLALFREEISKLDARQNLPSKSKLKPLNPFLDPYGVLRVGGRLEFADLPYENRHPIILANHHVTILIIRHYHQKLLHAGLQLTLHSLRETYWIIGARQLVKGMQSRCVTCIRGRAQPLKQQMSPLPASRCVQSHPFTHTGVDYAGPYFIRTAPGRGRSSYKGYLVVFVCFATKAVHLELVSDYSTATFLAALKRFVARRGLPKIMYSDQGTNFRGAKTELNRAFQDAVSSSQVQKQFSAEEVKWEFIPPAAPHFGGLWEAGVKSVKLHLRRIMGSFLPTFEEFYTIICQVESCLNSRPLLRLTDSSDQCQILTPGHLLMGYSPASLPDRTSLDLNPNLLTRWQTTSRIIQTFWKRWSQDYLHSLQTRNKWFEEAPNLQVGQVVLVRHPATPPGTWPLGVVTAVKFSKDGLVRCAVVRTALTTYERPISQLCVIPTD